MSTARTTTPELSLLLTGTIVPNAVRSAGPDPEARLAEYAEAIRFYQQHARITFLENSRYPLEQHPEFKESERLRVRRFTPSEHPERGKGYQEFEMLDAWLGSDSEVPARWLKVTGRYRVLNFGSILRECQQSPPKLRIDQARRGGVARTHLFCVDTDFYRERMAGLYRQCDDRTGEWIERVLFRHLKGAAPAEAALFKTQPRIAAVAGSGAVFPTGRGQWLFKQVLRSFNRALDRRYLWYAK